MTRNHLWKKLQTAILFLLSCAMASPVLIVLICSFMREEEIRISFGGILSGGAGYASVPLLPYRFTFGNYRELLMQTEEFFIMFWNSALQVSGIVAGQLLVGAPAAWALAKWKTPLAGRLFALYTVLMLIPFQVSMVPEYLILSRLGLLDTQLSVILPEIFATFPVFIMTRFFRAVPDELLEAARLDGAAELTIFCRVGLPMGESGIGAAVILSFLEYWNAIEAPMTFLQQRSKWPVSLYLPDITAENAGPALAASVIMLIPPLLVFLAGHDRMEEGIANTGLKG